MWRIRNYRYDEQRRNLMWPINTRRRAAALSGGHAARRRQ